MDSGATVNGRKPIPSATNIVTNGRTGSDPEPGVKASQIAGEGAGPGDGGGTKIAPGPASPPLNSPAAAAERTTTGTTAEEQDSRQKRMAVLYPTAKGSKQYGQGGGL